MADKTYKAECVLSFGSDPIVIYSGDNPQEAKEQATAFKNAHPLSRVTINGKVFAG